LRSADVRVNPHGMRADARDRPDGTAAKRS
jgi:hypothetical protein